MLAVIGAIVGEFVGAQVGLGYLIVALNFNSTCPACLRCLIVLSAIGLVMHGVDAICGAPLHFLDPAQ